MEEGPNLSPSMSSGRVNFATFYGEYHGHPLPDLESVLAHLPNMTAARAPRRRGVIYLVGDSTLDNKYWLGGQRVPATNGYERLLKPPQAVPDVTHYLNKVLIERGEGDKLVAVNTAIEESTLGLRDGGKLLPQDAFVRDHIGEPDVLVVSCGGNDIALRPTALTIVSIATLLSLPKALINCGPWLTPGLHHFVSLFRDKTTRYVQSLIGDSKPRVVVVCMLYYLDECPGGSWADTTLRLLGYDKDPDKLQLCIRTIFEYATSQIQLPGVQVVHVPLFEALDGKTSADYVQRVEPSAQGGEKLARLILDRMLPAYERESAVRAAAPAASNMKVESATFVPHGAKGAIAKQPTDDTGGSRVVAMPTAVHSAANNVGLIHFSTPSVPSGAPTVLIDAG